MRTTLIFALILQCSIQCPLFAQSKNQLSIQTGLFHRFLDGAPLMNVGQYRTPWNNIFLESYGLQYQRKLNTSQFLAFSLSGYSNYCVWMNEKDSKLNVSSRTFATLVGTFSNSKSLSEKIDLKYGGGINFRMMIYSLDGYSDVSTLINVENYYDGTQFQMGTHGQISLNYNPLTWLTLYTQFNAEGYLFSNNFGTNWSKQAFDDFTYKKDFKFPSRFDLSLRFGVGINF
jgi:hypothetical protein